MPPFRLTLYNPVPGAHTKVMVMTGKSLPYLPVEHAQTIARLGAMNDVRKVRIKRLQKAAFERQKGRCYRCNVLMIELCRRRSNNPSLKRLGISVAPE